MAINTRQQTGTFIKIQAAAGNKLKVPREPTRVIQADRKPIPLPQEVGESKGGAAIHPRPPLAEMGGNPGRRVLEVPRAAEEEVGAAGAADVDKHAMLSRSGFKLAVRCREGFFQREFWR